MRLLPFSWTDLLRCGVVGTIKFLQKGKQTISSWKRKVIRDRTSGQAGNRCRNFLLNQIHFTYEIIVYMCTWTGYSYSCIAPKKTSHLVKSPMHFKSKSLHMRARLGDALAYELVHVWSKGVESVTILSTRFKSRSFSYKNFRRKSKVKFFINIYIYIFIATYKVVVVVEIFFTGSI